MADVFATIVAPDQYKVDALILAQGSMDFSGGKTTNPNGSPPATHWLSSGYIPEAVKTAFLNDARFTVSDLNWRSVCTSMGLFAIVQTV
jgi:hypothetical protein